MEKGSAIRPLIIKYSLLKCVSCDKVYKLLSVVLIVSGKIWFEPCPFVRVCVDDGWFKPPHLARARLMGLSLGEAAHLQRLNQPSSDTVERDLHGRPGYVSLSTNFYNKNPSPASLSEPSSSPPGGV